MSHCVCVRALPFVSHFISVFVCGTQTKDARWRCRRATIERKTFNPEAILLNDAELNVTILVAAAAVQQQQQLQSYNNTWAMIKWRYFFRQLYNRWFRFSNALRPKPKPHSHKYIRAHAVHAVRSPRTRTHIVNRSAKTEQCAIRTHVVFMVLYYIHAWNVVYVNGATLTNHYNNHYHRNRHHRCCYYYMLL